MATITEYKDYPKWIDTVTKEEQYQWYLRAKELLPILERTISTEKLREAIAHYETQLKPLDINCN